MAILPDNLSLSPARWCGYAGAAVLLALFASGEARATCGDYLQVGKSIAHEGTLEGEHSEFDQLPAPVQRTPCQGPSCRSQRPVPLPTPPLTLTASPDEVAVRSSDAPPACATLAEWTEAVTVFPASGHPSRLKRPPRS